MLHLDMPSIELAVMRARGIAGRHQRWGSGREDEDPLVATDYGYLKLEDDEDDEVAQDKLLILVEKDVKTGTTCCNLSSRQRSHVVVGVPVASGIAERCCKVMESHRS